MQPITLIEIKKGMPFVEDGGHFGQLKLVAVEDAKHEENKTTLRAVIITGEREGATINYLEVDGENTVRLHLFTEKSDERITSARIDHTDKYKHEVFGTINGAEVSLFGYYPDELTFAESEFIGLTREEALALFTKKDVAYLQS